MGVALNKAALVRQEVVSPVCCLVKDPVQRWAGFIQQEPWIDAKVCAGLVLDRWTTLEHQEIRAVGVPLCLLAKTLVVITDDHGEICKGMCRPRTRPVDNAGT